MARGDFYHENEMRGYGDAGNQLAMGEGHRS